MWVGLVYAFFLNSIAELLNTKALRSLSSSMDAFKLLKSIDFLVNCLFYLKLFQIRYVIMSLKITLPIGNFIWKFYLLVATNKKRLELNAMRFPLWCIYKY